MKTLHQFITEASSYTDAYKKQHQALMSTVEKAAIKHLGTKAFIEDEYDTMGLVFVKSRGFASTKDLMAARNEIAKQFHQYTVTAHDDHLEIDIT